MLTREERSRVTAVSPELREFLAGNPKPQPIPEDILVMREFGRKVEAAELKRLGPVNASVVKESWMSIPMHDGHENKAKVWQPVSPPAKGSALVVIYHGGGFAVGSPDMWTSVGRVLVELYGVVCVSPCYRLVPENPFPIGAMDAWDALSYIAINAKAVFNADPSLGFIVGGASAGGNLAAVVTQLAKDHNLSPPLTGQYLSVPLIMWEQSVPDEYRDEYLSLTQVGDPLHPPSSMTSTIERYSPDATSIYFSPLNSKSGQSGLPPAYIQACGLDCIMDDALIYDKILKKNGVKTKLDLYPGLPHGFWLFMPTLKSSLEAMADIVQGHAELLHRAVDRDTKSTTLKGNLGHQLHRK